MTFSSLVIVDDLPEAKDGGSLIFRNVKDGGGLDQAGLEVGGGDGEGRSAE